MTPGVPATLSGIRPLRRAEQPYSESRLMVVCAGQDRSLAGQPASGVCQWYSAEVRARGHEKCPVLLMHFRFN
jgi:hypothetical protein